VAVPYSADTPNDLHKQLTPDDRRLKIKLRPGADSLLTHLSALARGPRRRCCLASWTMLGLSAPIRAGGAEWRPAEWCAAGPVTGVA
jgi:hypothetical protein